MKLYVLNKSINKAITQYAIDHDLLFVKKYITFKVIPIRENGVLTSKIATKTYVYKRKGKDFSSFKSLAVSK